LSETTTIKSTTEQRVAMLRRVHHKILEEARARVTDGQTEAEARRDATLANLPPATAVKVLGPKFADDAGVGPEYRELVEAISVVNQNRLAKEKKKVAKKGQFSHEPTPERRAQAVNGISETVVVPAAGPVHATKSHTIVDYVTKNKAEFTAAEMAAIEWARDLCEAYCNVRLTMNWDGASGGGMPGRKMGGLGNVTETMRAKHTAYEYIRRKMPTEFVVTLEALLVQLRFDDRNISPAEFAAKLFPSHVDKSFRSGVSLTAAKYTAILLSWLYVREVGLRPSGPPRRVVQIMTEPVT